MLQTRRVASDAAVHVATLSPETDALPLVMCHGVGRRWQTFIPLVPSLAIRRGVHALDFRGHGQSERTPSRYRVADYARDAIAVVQDLGRPAILYGHSLGALVSIVVAAKLPDRVAAIILEDPPAPQLLETLDRSPYGAMFAAYQRVAGTTQSVSSLARELADVTMPDENGDWKIRLGDVRDAVSLRFMASCLKQLDPETMASLLDKSWLAGLDWDDCLAGARCPALLLRGEERRGGMLSSNEAARMVSKMADALCIDVPGVGHNIHSQATEAGLRFTLPFLDSLTE